MYEITDQQREDILKALNKSVIAVNTDITINFDEKEKHTESILLAMKIINYATEKH